MVVKLYNILVVKGFHNFELSVFVFLVLMDMFYSDFLAVVLEIFGLFDRKILY